MAAFIKDATARLVVEIAKREWPQQWPTMLQVGSCENFLFLRGLFWLVSKRAVSKTLLLLVIILSRDDSSYSLTGYSGYGFVTNYTILTV